MKKLLILRNSDTKEIVGTAEPVAGDAELTPLPSEGQEVVELEVPDNFVLKDKVRLQLVKDSTGKVIASMQDPEEGSAASLSVEVEKGQYVEEVEEPASYLLDIDGMYKKHSKK